MRLRGHRGRLRDAPRAAAGSTGHPEAGRFTGYKPYAEAWGPDVLWMEGTLQMRMAKAAAGVSTAVIDENAARWATLGTGGLLPQAERTLVGNPAGDYHTWPAAAPAAWLRLASSGSTILS